MLSGSPELKHVAAKSFCPVETFGLTPESDWQAGDVQWHDSATEFRVAHHGREVARIRMPLVGQHNVLNALAATAIAIGRGVPADAIQSALATFISVRKRMEIKGEERGVLVVEDFAHHPTAIRLTLEAARTRWPGQRVWAVVEPRTNTMRRKIFQDVLPDALALADAVLIGPVNRAQLLGEDERLSPETIASLIQQRGRPAKAFAATAEITDYLFEHAKPKDVVMIMSNGSFDGLSGKLLAALKAQTAGRA